MPFLALPAEQGVLADLFESGLHLQRKKDPVFDCYGAVGLAVDPFGDDFVTDGDFSIVYEHSAPSLVWSRGGWYQFQ